MTACINDSHTRCTHGGRPMCRGCSRMPPTEVSLGLVEVTSGVERTMQVAPALNIPLDDEVRAFIARAAGRRVEIIIREAQ